MKKNEKLQKKIFLDRKSDWGGLSKIMSFSEGYKEFMSSSKTERLAIANIIKALESSGFARIEKVKTKKPGTKFYKEIKGKSVIAGIIGKDPDMFQVIGSHVDSPRLDLKPSPLYEDAGLAMLQSHYYGGIKKYQWVNVPLALHGVIFTKSGKKVELSIGDRKGDPVFIIPDIEPHLAKPQMERKPNKIVEGEELNILFGNIPIDDDDIKEQVKLAVMKRLNEDYGLIEEDFNTAELEFVPAYEPVDVGLDRSMVGAYGQDDKVCVYTSLQAILQVKVPVHTAVAMFVDKEEIGSVGDTGAASFMLQTFAGDYLSMIGSDLRPSTLLEHSRAISADTTVAMNPNFKDVNDPQNVSYLGKGVAVEKYGGGGGKYNTNDAHAEYMSYMRGLLDKNKISWQTGELGKIDIGGGGTIAMFLSRYGMDCIDAGPPGLAMHAPIEVMSKADIYSAFRLYKVFFSD